MTKRGIPKETKSALKERSTSTNFQYIKLTITDKYLTKYHCRILQTSYIINYTDINLFKYENIYYYNCFIFSYINICSR